MKKERTSLRLAELEPNTGQLEWLPKNPRQWTQDDIDRTAKSIAEDYDFLEDRPLLAVPHDGRFVVFAGNLRMTAARQGKVDSVPVIVYTVEDDADQQTILRRAMKDNGSFGAWDWDALANEWDDLPLGDWGVPAWKGPEEDDDEGSSNDDGSVYQEGALEAAFIVPPFSVLDMRAARWQERKAAWNEKIGDLGESRGELLFSSPEMRMPGLYREYLTLRRKGQALDKGFKDWLNTLPPERLEAESNKRSASGVSILDPVLAEIACLWFGIAGGRAFDPFAGDTCFGFVSASCGMKFTGIELRKEQADLNNKRVEGMTARYICDDGQNVAAHIEKESQDLLFSCPPYYNLEVYSDDPKDASNQETYEDFLAILRNAFTAAVGCLKENRFAVIVVGDVRDNDSGEYYDFPSDIARIFRDAGLHLMNELILVEPTPSAGLRAGNFMEGRKVVKCHQNVLVFYKGNPLLIANNFFPIDMSKEEAAEVNELIKSLETPEMEGLPEEEYCAAIAEKAREKCGQYVKDSRIQDMKNAMTWAKGMIQTQMFKPLVDYFNTAKKESGVTMKKINEHLGNTMGGHYFTEKSQWLLPTEENYEKLQQIIPGLVRPYDEIRQEYQELQRLQDLQRFQNLQRLQNLRQNL